MYNKISNVSRREMGNQESQPQNSSVNPNQYQHQLEQQRKLIEEQNKRISRQEQQLNYLIQNSKQSLPVPPVKAPVPTVNPPPSTTTRRELVTVPSLSENKQIIDSMERKEQARRREFENEMKERKRKYQEEIHKMESHKDIALKVLKVDENYTEESLKRAYLKMAMKYHPDKGGNADAFQLIAKSYALLNDLYQKQHQHEKNMNRNIQQLQEEHREVPVTANPNKYVFSNGKNDRFDVNMFNKMYQENRLGDPTDYGYGEWLNEEQKEATPELFSDKFNVNMFNKVFEQTKKVNRKEEQIIQYTEPATISLKGENYFSSLGDDNISDFSGNGITGLSFTDVKKAHTNNTLIDPQTVQYKTYNSVKQYENERSKMSFQMNETDRQYYEQKKREDELREQKRLQNVSYRDQLIMDHHSRLNNLITR